ncbi:MAG: VOC family protein [Ilumatobacter sp.]|jgi:catechol 2,3-dioxygenase-like lactoylglutathione lyase family enzyme|uniref:VOC family protein n=1 Tax=Ilumatobacter sp. TaxID=1967498 RepID=UPI00391AB319
MEFPHHQIFQVAYLVNDLRASVQEWDALFGAGPFVITEHHQTDTFDYRGTQHEADVSYAFGYLGDMMIQFIVQHDDTPSIYRDMYEAGETGFHHVGLLCEDVRAEVDRLGAAGFECATFLHADGVDAAYVDTRAVNGGFTEYHGTPPRIIQAFTTWREAHARRQPGDSPFMER